jgi:putative endonuclease
MPPADASARARAGAQAEALAASFLERNGLAIVARNVRSRLGEIDVVAREGNTLVFVEVRLRRHRGFGGAAGSITAAKRARIRAAAELYLARLPRVPPCRIDALLLDALDPSRIEWVKDIGID